MPKAAGGGCDARDIRWSQREGAACQSHVEPHESSADEENGTVLSRAGEGTVTQEQWV